LYYVPLWGLKRARPPPPGCGLRRARWKATTDSNYLIALNVIANSQPAEVPDLG
jgi:hypothetical protein